MNWDIVRDSLPLYGWAALLTLTIGVIGIVLSMIVGIVCAAVQHYRVQIARQCVALYVELSRNTPLLVQLFFLYFGLPKIGITWSSTTCAIIGLTFLGGAYMAEALRSGLDAVPVSQKENALALGFTSTQTLRYIVLPQAFATALPALSANVIFLIKETSVFSIIALPDLVYVAKEQIGNTYNTQEALFLLVFYYLLILLPISLAAGRLERRARYASLGV
ncbi:amino acid ABC transporter permease [Actinotignum urinale]|uniref:Amino acid ABC transporter permease n=1 Tax=Actinotignum urinale TaxID=190146 RepID=A0ABU5G664_9ACTO|nr:amino acid ABC transporter permease [Actinotignum urinale]MDY5129201.1 amino acid ABC transporter permease [Actinotignum urinale]MDY5132389.1 amino acid ABC transporter permease [Actinotignum urinale]MDY5160727.1 amino acid ABC transporter permease [Actinotignum urinale]WIK59777.1 amino acid ABC transporter permease [Actinotignum urinale]